MARALRFLGLACGGVLLLGSIGYGQALGPRKLAPGVITTIRDAAIDDATVDSPREFTELIRFVNPQEWQPNFDPTTQTLLGKAQRVILQREIWSLEFGFKSLRVIRVGGEDIWYLVYFVRNVGETRTPSPSNEETIQIKGSKRDLAFVPTFVLRAHQLGKSYRDQVIPEAVRLIAAKERVTRGTLHHSASISRIKIPVSTDTADNRVWGVATWRGVDPKADFISIFVEGLTNAYRWEPPKDGYAPSRTPQEQDVVLSKALQLNFWRGGDAIELNDVEIRYGIPLYPNDRARQLDVLKAYGVTKPTEYRWVYR